MPKRVSPTVREVLWLSALAVTGGSVARAQSAVGDPAELIGIWRGTSVCTDRVAAPACHDETVVYEFTAGSEPDTVHWVADKVVSGRRQRMGGTQSSQAETAVNHVVHDDANRRDDARADGSDARRKSVLARR